MDKRTYEEQRYVDLTREAAWGGNFAAFVVFMSPLIAIVVFGWLWMTGVPWLLSTALPWAGQHWFYLASFVGLVLAACRMLVEDV